jgi:hypothetical protein
MFGGLYMNRSDSMIMSFGISVLGLGILRHLEIIKFDNAYLFSIALAALFFTIAEFADSPIITSRRKLYIILGPNTFYSIAIISMIIYPHIMKKYDESTLIKSNETVTLIALGLVIVLIAVKSIQNSSEKEKTINEYRLLVSDIKQFHEEYKDIKSKEVDVLKEMIKQYKIRIELYEKAMETNEKLRDIIVNKENMGELRQENNIE